MADEVVEAPVAETAALPASRAFTVIDAVTRRVMSSGVGFDLSVLADGVSALLLEGVQHVDGWVDADGAQHDVPPCPIPGATWDWESKSWVDERPINEVRVARRDALVNARTAAVCAVKQTSVGLFDADLTSQQNLATVITLTRLAAARGYPAQANYTMADNVRRTLTLDQLETAAFEMGAQGQAIFDAVDAKLQELQSATTRVQIEAITWAPASASAGQPSV